MTLDIESGMRQLDGVAGLTYDAKWVNAAETNVVMFKMSVNGGEIAQVAGIGEVKWSTRRPGTYVVTAAKYEDGAAVGDPLTATFVVEGRDLVRAQITLDAEGVLYDGTGRMPHPTVVLDGATLVEGIDYVVSYEDNVQPGKGKVIITGLGKYQDEIEVPFTIIPAGVCSFDLTEGVREARGTEHLAYDSTWLGTNGATVRVFADTTQIGEATGVGTFDWTPIAAGDYALTLRTYQEGVALDETYTASFRVSGAGIPFDIELNAESFVFSGEAIVPKVTVRYAGTTLTEGVDYSLSFVGNDQGGVAKVVVTGLGRYTGTAEKPFRVIPAATCALDIYDGVRVTADAQKIAYDTLWSGTDNSTVKVVANEVQIAEDTKAGDVIWTPGGAGMYTPKHTTYSDGVQGETLTATFHVTGQDLVHADVTINEATILYDGTERRPSATITYQGKTLTEGVDYSLSYSKNIEPGMGVMTVTGLGAYRDIVDVPFEIRPAGICSLDIESGTRHAKSSELLNYDYAWCGDTNENMRMQIRVNDEILANMTGIGSLPWNPTVGGSYVVTLRTYIDDYLQEDKILTAYFDVTGGEQPFPEGSIVVTVFHGEYDGKPHSITVKTTSIANPAITYALEEAGPFRPTNPSFVTVTNQVVWCVIAADGYITQTNSASVVITESEIVNPFDPDDPTKPVTPEVLAKANCVTNYDGDGHSIEVVPLLNPLIAANNPQVTYSLLQNGIYEAMNPVFTNVVATSVWYRIVADNFKSFTTNALLTIAPRPITKATMDVIADQTYTGSAITPVPTVRDERTLIGAAEPTNIITSADYEVSYADNVNVGTAKIIFSGTNNYEGVVTNTFNITAAPIPFDSSVGITATGYTNVYDGAAHGVVVKATGLKTIATVQYKSSATADWQNASPTYTDVCDTQVWWKVSAPNYRTVEGAIGLKITPRPVTLTSGTKSDFVYDGQPHQFSVLGKSENGFVAGEGITTSNWATVTTVAEGEVANTFDYAAIEGTKLSNYDITVVTGKIAVVAAEIGPGGDEPGPGEIPEGGLSKFDATYVYDGAGHTINTQALYAVTLAGATPRFSFSLESNGVYQTAPFVYTNVGEYVCWYKTEAPNYKTFVHQAKLTIEHRSMTNVVVGAVGSVVYNGNPQCPVPSVSDMVEMPGSEGPVNIVSSSDYDISYQNNTNAGTALIVLSGKGNYEGSVTSSFVIAHGMIPWQNITANDTVAVYDGQPKSVAVEATDDQMTIKPTVLYATSSFGPWSEQAPSCTDVGQMQVRYRISAANYRDAIGSVLLQVNPRPVTLTSGTKTDFVYDGQPREFSVLGKSENGFVADEGITTSNWATVTTVAEGEVANTFDYAAIEGTKLSNYDITVVTGKIAVVQKDIGGGDDDPDKPDPTKPDAVSRFDGVAMYDGAGHTIDTNALVSALGKVIIGGGETRAWYARGQDADSAVAPTSGWVSEPPVFTNACEEIVWYKVTNPNYADYVHAAKVTITNRPVTVTSASGNWVFDTAAHSTNGVEVAIGGNDAQSGGRGATALPTIPLIGEDTIEVGGFPSITDVGSKPNAFNWTFGAGTLATNYCVSVVTGTLTVTARPVGDDPANWDIRLGEALKYNGKEQSAPIIQVAFRKSDGNLVDIPYTLQNNKATDAGNYKVKITGTGNYAGTIEKDWAIVERNLMFTSMTTNWVYDGIAHTADVVTVTGDGFVDGEGVTFADFPVVRHVADAASAIENRFTYALKAGTKAGNYDITEVVGTLTVTKATYPGQEPGGAGITWNVAPDAATWMYDGAEHGVTVTGVPTGVTPVYTGNVAKDAGEYTASVTFVYDAANYEAPVAPAPIKWSITPRPITLMAASKDKPYDGFPLEVEPGDITASGSGYAAGECFDYYDRASITDVGETPATFKYRDSANTKVANYVVTVKGGQTLKVTVGGDQISVTADSETWAYDGEEHTKKSWTFVNESKLLAGHAFQIKIADASKIATPKDGLEHNGIVSNAFEYVKIVETSTGKDRTKNYNLFVYEGVLQMTNRVICSEELRMKNEEFKPRIEKVYDGVATQVVVSAALLQPEAVRYWGGPTSVSAADATERVPPDVVWRDEPYAFTHATNAVVWFTVAADYYNTYTGKVEVAIAKRPVIVKTPTKSKAYDGGALTFGAEEVEVLGGPTSVSAACGTDGTEPVPPGESFVFSDFASITDAGKIDSTCSIAAGANTSLDDYDITKQWGTLTVLASADQITVTAKNGEWTYDAQPHDLHEYVAENESKLLSGDTLSVTFDPQSVITNPDDGPKSDGVVSNVITSVKVMRGDVDVSKNYSLAWYSGVLKMKNATMTVDDSGFSTTAVYDGDGHTVNVVAPTLLTSPVVVKYGTASDAVTLTVPPDFTDAGTHTVFYQISAKYYNTYSGSATATVTPRPVTLVSGSATRVYNGQPLRKNEVSVKEGSLDFVKSEGFSATCSGSITGVGGMENLFDYELTGGAKSDNYTIKKEYGWLRVSPAPLDPAVVIGTDPIACEWVYDAEAHPFVVMPTMSEPYKMYYSLTENDESTYSEEILAFTKATANPVPVYFKLMSANFEPLYGTGTVHITKCPMTPPEIASKVYNGTVQTADVQIAVLHGKDAYRILANSGRVEAGEAAVILMLNDSKNYKWTTTDKSFVTSSFVISQAENTWATQPSISGWSIKDQPSVPVAAAKFGTVSITYNGTTKSGATIKDALAVTEPGIYTAVFVVPADTSWTGLRSEVVFTVSDGGETPLTVKALGYLGVYDGKPHTISVTVTGGDGNFELTYSESETGPWQKDPPTYVEPCAKTVWYRVTSPNYATMTGKATVTISEAKQETVVVKPEGSSKSISIPSSWFQQYPQLGGSTVQDWQVISQQPDGKTDANGNAMYVWQDYVAGTDPTDLNSRFTATITFEDGVPVVKWSPALNGEGVKTGTRTYTTLGKVNLTDKEWKTVSQGEEKNYNFFTVTVDMPEGK